MLSEKFQEQIDIEFMKFNVSVLLIDSKSVPLTMILTGMLDLQRCALRGHVCSNRADQLVDIDADKQVLLRLVLVRIHKGSAHRIPQ